MPARPLISVIVPVYNVKGYLRECADSILGQTYSRLELVLVDDGSTDGSGRLCDEYAKADRRVRVIHQENGGLMWAWMAGVKAAEGEYFCFVDGDDWIEPCMLEELAQKAMGAEREMICGNYIIEKKKSSVPVIQGMRPGVYDRQEIRGQLFPRLLGQEKRSIHFSRCMKLIARRLVLDNLCFCHPALTMGEDMNILVPALIDAERIVVVEEGLYYHYRFVAASMVHRYSPGLAANIHLLYSVVKEIVEKKGVSLCPGSRERADRETGQLRDGLKKEYIWLMLLAIKNELRGPGRGCGRRIRQEVEKAKQLGGLSETGLTVREKSNRLLYSIWKNPGRPRIFLGRQILRVFDWLTG